MVAPPADPAQLVKRHRLSTRIWHWTNAMAVFVMLMSGLMIFNAHPRLYWGHYGANSDPAWFEIGANATQGMVRTAGVTIVTTGVLGKWTDREGIVRNRAFPWWATIPSDYSLSAARRWHLAFAWVLGLVGFVWLLRAWWNGHVTRDLLPRRAELKPSHIWQDVKDHARLRFPTGEDAARYNILQKLAYGSVIFLLLPLIILTGLGLSPGMDAAWPWLLDLLGGRQSARSLHFIAMLGMIAFILVHLAMVVLAGPYNEIRSMITGRFRLPKERRP